MRRPLFIVLTAAVIALVACTEEDEPEATTSGPTTGGACLEGNTVTDGKLTIATDEPAFEPWFIDDDPTNGQGFEGAVAAEIASRLGVDPADVVWVRVPFNAAIQPGPKDFDFDINQFSITPERAEQVDFSSAYYDVQQTVITIEGSPAADVTSLDDLKDLTLGAQVGTTSLAAIEEVIQPTSDAQVFNTNEDAKTALENGQVDAIVVDLPTAFFMVAAELDAGVLVGQLPPTEGDTPEQFGLVLDKGSPLTACVSAVIDEMDTDGTLGEFVDKWLAADEGAPLLA